MKWNDGFLIGIDVIDSQHKKIFEHLLALENAVTKKDPWNILQFFLVQLTEYMKFHLAVEEALLEVIQYPDRTTHCGSHGRLIDQVAKLEEQLRSKPSGENLVGFFEDWFVRHVLASDRDYADYVSREFPAISGQRAA